ncbi:hypothetical protein V1460_30335 [Streptomyces sp. SCSIO 30461]|uniref:hypothetical protein n=1 Tax=Streptomyces sp. SCSIO 30461 TaxID=3118085 RepID=UPI0030CE9176
MSTGHRPSTMDDHLTAVFAASLAELYEAAMSPDVSPALTRGLELRSFLALAEAQVVRVRDRVHAAMSPEGDLGDLSADKLRFDAQWLDAALDARDSYRAALGELLRTMPPTRLRRPVPVAQARLATTGPTAVPAPPRAGTARARHP